MPQHKSAEKRVRQNERRRLRNKIRRSIMKTAIKKVNSATEKETAVTELKKATSVIDRMALKGIIHKNKASNLKSKLTKRVNAL
ncbi:30S ribosomal protein S20 [bacterium]|nr:30S ribosomal protein S20 [bacterium]